MGADGDPFCQVSTKICEQGGSNIVKTVFDSLDPNSITYKIKTYAFDDGLPEEWLEHVKTYRKIVAGQNITAGGAAFTTLKTAQGQGTSRL